MGVGGRLVEDSMHKSAINIWAPSVSQISSQCIDFFQYFPHLHTIIFSTDWKRGRNVKETLFTRSFMQWLIERCKFTEIRNAGIGWKFDKFIQKHIWFKICSSECIKLMGAKAKEQKCQECRRLNNYFSDAVKTKLVFLWTVFCLKQESEECCQCYFVAFVAAHFV